jgi:hypothetical protein
VFQNEPVNVGYTLSFAYTQRGFLGREKVVYRFTAMPVTPIIFVQEDGTRLRTCDTFITDQGSQPLLVQGWLPKDRHPAVYFHDDQYRAGGAWVAAPGQVLYTFQPFTRSQSDLLLRTMLMCGTYPLSKSKAYAYWVGLRTGSVVGKLAFWVPPLFHTWEPGRDGTESLAGQPAYGKGLS